MIKTNAAKTAALVGVFLQIPQTANTETILLIVVVPVYIAVIVVHPVKYDLSLLPRNILP